VLDEHRPSLNVVHGLIGAVVSAIAAPAMVALLSFGFIICRWALTGATEFDREYDLQDARDRLPYAAVGCAIIAACAGWTTFAAGPPRRFAQMFALVSVASIISWCIIGLFELAPRRYKGVSHPFLYFSETTVLIGPPVTMALILTVIRLRTVKARPGE
jgi:L-asparagine transporter-like permease